MALINKMMAKVLVPSESTINQCVNFHHKISLRPKF